MAAWSETGPDTIVCGLDESVASSAAAAYADWLATNIGMKLQLSDAGPRELAGRTERTRFLVTAVAPEGQWTTASLCDLIERSRCPVVVLPEGAARVWMSPSRARRVVRPTVVCGAVGSPAAPEGVRQAAAAAAMLSGTLVLVEARSRPAHAAPSMVGATEEADGLEEPPLSGRVVIRTNNRLLEIRGTTSHGSPAEVLDGIAGAERGAMIAVATEGLHPERLALEGSVTLELLDTARHPILVVRGPG